MRAGGSWQMASDVTELGLFEFDPETTTGLMGCDSIQLEWCRLCSQKEMIKKKDSHMMRKYLPTNN